MVCVSSVNQHVNLLFPERLPAQSLLDYLLVIVTHLQGGWTMLAVLISSFPCFLKVQWIIQSLCGSHLPIMVTLWASLYKGGKVQWQPRSFYNQAQWPPCAFHPMSSSTHLYIPFCWHRAYLLIKCVVPYDTIPTSKKSSLNHYALSMMGVFNYCGFI